MEQEKVTVIFNIPKRNFSVDLDIPLNITANDLFIALNDAYNLGVDITDINRCYLKAEKPIGFIKGNRMLGEFGLRDGSNLYFI